MITTYEMAQIYWFNLRGRALSVVQEICQRPLGRKSKTYWDEVLLHLSRLPGRMH